MAELTRETVIKASPETIWPFLVDPDRHVEWLGTVADIYRKFDIPLTDEARQAMEASHAESQSGARAPKHTYSLADYGLTAEAVKERFAGL